jgi:hypothetical protein
VGPESPATSIFGCTTVLLQMMNCELSQFYQLLACFTTSQNKWLNYRRILIASFYSVGKRTKSRNAICIAGPFQKFREKRPLDYTHAGLEGGLFKSHFSRENGVQKSILRLKRLQERTNGSKNEHVIPYPRAWRGPWEVTQNRPWNSFCEKLF